MVGTAKEETMENAKGRIVIAFTVLILGISLECTSSEHRTYRVTHRER
jgi:hypothetical protein